LIDIFSMATVQTNWT